MTQVSDFAQDLIRKFDQQEAAGHFSAGVPGIGEDTGIALRKVGRYRSAARAWQAGADVSLGHNRTARYEAAAARCLAIANGEESPPEGWPASVE